MINQNLIESKIKTGEVEIIKKWQRKVDGKNILTIKINEELYKLCAGCKLYMKVEHFHRTNGQPKGRCKQCDNKYYNDKYHNDMESNIRQRWHSLVSREKNKNKRCTREEFAHFFKTERCPYTHRTLEEDFYNPPANRMFRLEVDHIKPVSEGGTSVVENLRVVPKFINQAKRNSTYDEWRECEDFLFGGGQCK